TARKANPGQDENIKAQTIFWLDAEGIPYDELHFSSDKTSVQTDYFIEDRIENFEHILENSETDAYLLDQPWNRNFEDWHDLFRFTSVQEYVDHILEQRRGAWTQVAELALTLESGREEAVSKSLFDDG